jgi:hypothetical protein
MIVTVVTGNIPYSCGLHSSYWTHCSARSHCIIHGAANQAVHPGYLSAPSCSYGRSAVAARFITRCIRSTQQQLALRSTQRCSIQIGLTICSSNCMFPHPPTPHPPTPTTILALACCINQKKGQYLHCMHQTTGEAGLRAAMRGPANSASDAA